MRNKEDTPAWISHLRVHNLRVLDNHSISEKRYRQSYDRWQRAVGTPDDYFEYHRKDGEV